MALLDARRTRSVNDIENSIRSELENLRPLLGVDHCAIELLRFDPSAGVAIVRIDATCAECEVTGSTFLPGIETRLKLRVTELRAVRVERLEER